jgi:hypothetical protein
MRMRFAVGGSRHGVQHSHGSRQALSLLRSRLGRPSGSDDGNHRSATLLDSSDMDMAPSRAGRVGDVSPRRRARGSGPGMEGRVLEPLDLADSQAFPPYWNFLWSLNRPTYCSSQSSSGSPSKSSTVVEAAGAAAVYPFCQTRIKPDQACSTPRPLCDRRECPWACGPSSAADRSRRSRHCPNCFFGAATSGSGHSRFSHIHYQPPSRDVVITPGVSLRLRRTTVKPNPDRKEGDSLA